MTKPENLNENDYDTVFFPRLYPVPNISDTVKKMEKSRDQDVMLWLAQLDRIGLEGAES